MFFLNSCFVSVFPIFLSSLLESFFLYLFKDCINGTSTRALFLSLSLSSCLFQCFLYSYDWISLSLFTMNSQKIVSHEHQQKSLNDDECFGCSIGSFGSREAMNQQHLFQPCISDSFPSSFIGSNPASFYATELLMGFPWFDNRLRVARSPTDTLPQFDCSAVSRNMDRVQLRNTAENELQSVGQSLQMMGVRIHA